MNIEGVHKHDDDEYEGEGVDEDEGEGVDDDEDEGDDGEDEANEQ